jgi:hypothetical protein
MVASTPNPSLLRYIIGPSGYFALAEQPRCEDHDIQPFDTEQLPEKGRLFDACHGSRLEQTYRTDCRAGRTGPGGRLSWSSSGIDSLPPRLQHSSGARTLLKVAYDITNFID